MWFLKSVEETLEGFNVDPATGLSEEEVEKRLQKYGPNELQEKQGKTILQLFIEQLKDTLIYVLLGASVITLFMGEYIDTVIILLVVIVNAVLGVAQQVKAGKAIEALRKMASPRNTKAPQRKDARSRFCAHQ